MGDDLRIAAGERADAVCIADALASHDAGLEFDDAAAFKSTRSRP
jgi:hypothetical protein